MKAETIARNGRVFACAPLFLVSAALAGPIGSGLTQGAIRAAGFPTPLNQNTLAAVSLKSGSGGGSTGGGFGVFVDRGPPVGTASASIQIIDGPGSATVSINGIANHNINDGFTAAWSQTPVVLELTKGVAFDITNNSGTWSGSWILTQPVTFEAITGVIITGDGKTGVLGPGSYRLSFAAAAGRMDSFEAQVSVAPWYGWAGSNRIYSTEVHWDLKLSDKNLLIIGGGTPPTSYYVQGQSFTPDSFGPVASPDAPAATPISTWLTQIAIGFDTSYNPPLDRLYIYASPPTPVEAAAGTGSIATGAHIGDGVYTFDSVALDFHTKYYAVLPQAAAIFDGPGDFYTGGVDLFPRLDMNPVRVAEGYGDFDIQFSAKFEYIAGCPADINLDGFVNDADFESFAFAYSALLCSDAAMPGNCPSNLNTDLVVDDADFIIFVAAYDELICP